MMRTQLSHIYRRTQACAGYAAINHCRPQAIARRWYAEAAHEGKKRNDMPWLVLSIGLTVPAALYLWSKGPKETQHGAGPQRPLVRGPSQSERDPAEGIKPPKSFTKESGAQTTKQQGFANKETMNPFLYASGKSEKPEGVTETSKLMGTVSPERGKNKE